MKYQIYGEAILHSDEAIEKFGFKKPVNIPLILYVVEFVVDGKMMQAFKWINPAASHNYWNIIAMDKDSIILMKIAEK